MFLLLFRYECFNILRSRWILAYFFLFFALVESFLQFSSPGERVVLSLLQVLLLFVPLVSLFFSMLYWYYSEGSNHLFISLPIRRDQLFLAKLGALMTVLSLCFALGFALPFLRHFWFNSQLLLSILLGLVLHWVFIAIGLALANAQTDKLKGLGLALALWFFVTFIYDGLLLAIFMAARDYPLEMVGIILTVLNPINMIRLLFLRIYDFSFLLNYTGVLLQQFFGSVYSFGLAITALLLWFMIPCLIARNLFLKQDL